jgi:hypothetical protein
MILVGGWPTPLKNMKVNGKDDIPYVVENKIHVWNHQPDDQTSLSKLVLRCLVWRFFREKTLRTAAMTFFTGFVWSRATFLQLFLGWIRNLKLHFFLVIFRCV